MITSMQVLLPVKFGVGNWGGRGGGGGRFEKLCVPLEKSWLRPCELPETNGQLKDSCVQTCDPIGNWLYSGITKCHFREFQFAA